MHRIQIPLTHKVLTTTHPQYLHNLISVQPPPSTCLSSRYLSVVCLSAELSISYIIIIIIS